MLLLIEFTCLKWLPCFTEFVDAKPDADESAGLIGVDQFGAGYTDIGAVSLFQQKPRGIGIGNDVVAQEPQESRAGDQGSHLVCCGAPSSRGIACATHDCIGQQRVYPLTHVGLAAEIHDETAHVGIVLRTQRSEDIIEALARIVQ